MDSKSVEYSEDTYRTQSHISANYYPDWIIFCGDVLGYIAAPPLPAAWPLPDAVRSYMPYAVPRLLLHMHLFACNWALLRIGQAIMHGRAGCRSLGAVYDLYLCTYRTSCVMFLTIDIIWRPATVDGATNISIYITRS